jgi:hypothetical protein
LETGNKKSPVEGDDLHILVWPVHSYINQGKTMIPLTVLFHFSVSEGREYFDSVAWV